MVFKDSISSQILLKKYAHTETNYDYLEGVKEIVRRGICVQCIICDGRKGLFNLFGNIPVQMCQFHQIAIIRRYLTKKPKTQCGKELQELTLLLAKSNKESFSSKLNEWHKKWHFFLDERRRYHNGKSRFVHKPIRSAYRSLKNHLPNLFVYEMYNQFNVPNTTNALDGHFANLKTNCVIIMG